MKQQLLEAIKSPSNLGIMRIFGLALSFDEITEILYPHLKGQIDDNGSFPCPLPKHKKGDNRPIVREIGENGCWKFRGWRCSAGCEGDQIKGTIEFIQIALDLEDEEQGYDVYHSLNDLKHLGGSYEELVDRLRLLYPNYYNENT